MNQWEKKMRRKQFDDLIINRPKAMKKFRRRLEVGITTVGWAIWIFICRPLFIILLWMVGFQFFYEHMIHLGGLSGLKEQGIGYTIAILLVYVVVRGWNVYNKIQYGKRNRRKAVPITKPEELDRYFRFPDHSSQGFQKTDRVSVEFGERGKIVLQDQHQPSSTARQGHFKAT